MASRLNVSGGKIVNRQDLESIVWGAINMVHARDAYLLENDVSEWAVAHRLAVYFEALFPGWNIDCEYNRQGKTECPKLGLLHNPVRPDVIVHHRGMFDREHNLLVIELKKLLRNLITANSMNSLRDRLILPKKSLIVFSINMDWRWC